VAHKFRTIKFAGHIPLIISAIRVFKENVYAVKLSTGLPEAVKMRLAENLLLPAAGIRRRYCGLSQVMPWHTFSSLFDRNSKAGLWEDPSFFIFLLLCQLNVHGQEAWY
jgi:hypothetical protein